MNHQTSTASRRASKIIEDVDSNTTSNDEHKHYNKEEKTHHHLSLLQYLQNRWRYMLLFKMKVCLYIFCAASLVLHNHIISQRNNIINNGEQYNMQQIRNLGGNGYLKNNKSPTIRKGKVAQVKTDGVQLMAEAGYTHRPKMIRLETVLNTDSSESSSSSSSSSSTPVLQKVERVIPLIVEGETLKFKKDYNTKDTEQKTEAIEKKTKKKDSCELQHDWQAKSFPTCNAFHEQDMTLIGAAAAVTNAKTRNTNNNNLTDTTGDEEQLLWRITYINSGAFRDVWRIYSDEYFTEPIALKTLVFNEGYNEDNYDRHRRDAVANERLTSSPFILSIYSACGNSAIVEFANGGNLDDILWEWEFSPKEKLILAYHVAAAVSDVHNVDGNGRAATISHTDIKPEQIIYVPKEGLLKLTDFNRCRFITWDKDKNEACPFEIKNNGGKYRSPEEYKYEPETEKIDVYMVGSILYTILTREWPFESDMKWEAIDKVKKGITPTIHDRYLNSTDAADIALIKAIQMSWEYDPVQRISSTELRDFLLTELHRIGSKDRIFFSD